MSKKKMRVSVSVMAHCLCSMMQWVIMHVGMICGSVGVCVRHLIDGTAGFDGVMCH